LARAAEGKAYPRGRGQRETPSSGVASGRREDQSLKERKRRRPFRRARSISLPEEKRGKFGGSLGSRQLDLKQGLQLRDGITRKKSALQAGRKAFREKKGTLKGLK